MSFVHQSHREWEGDHNRVDGDPAEITSQRDDGSVLDMLNHSLSKYGVLREIVASFWVTTVEEDQIRQCVEHLIGENGIEWVWNSRDIIKDLMEFHGFVRKDPAID